MQDILSMVAALRRPRLLIRTARLGVDAYRRDGHLQRLLGYGTVPRSAPALIRLIEMEADENDLRRTGDAAYSLARHVDLLIAMMGEARLLRAATPSGEVI